MKYHSICNLDSCDCLECWMLFWDIPSPFLFVFSELFIQTNRPFDGVLCSLDPVMCLYFLNTSPLSDYSCVFIPLIISFAIRSLLHLWGPIDQLLALILDQVEFYSESPFLLLHLAVYCLCFLLAVLGLTSRILSLKVVQKYFDHVASPILSRSFLPPPNELYVLVLVSQKVKKKDKNKE